MIIRVPIHYCPNQASHWSEASCGSRNWILMKKTIIGILGLGLVVVALKLTIFSVPDPLISRQDVLMAGDIERVKFLIAVGADINEPNTKGITPLHVVAQEGYPALAQLLIAYGANLHARYQNLWTPLHLAAQNGHLEVTNLLIAYGANVNGPKDTFTPLHFAAQEGHLDTARLLIAHGANVQGQYKNGWTPLHLAAQEGHTDMVTFLLDHGASIHAKNAFGFTPLHSAAFLGQLTTTKQLVERGAAVMVKDTSGQTPHHLALAGNYRAVAEFLRKYDAPKEDLEEEFSKRPPSPILPDRHHDRDRDPSMEPFPYGAVWKIA